MQRLFLAVFAGYPHSYRQGLFDLHEFAAGLVFQGLDLGVFAGP